MDKPPTEEEADHEDKKAENIHLIMYHLRFKEKDDSTRREWRDLINIKEEVVLKPKLC